MAISPMPIFGAGELKLFLLVKRKDKYSLIVKWGVYTLCGQCAIFWYHIYNYLKIFLGSIQSLEKPGGSHICLGHL
jgi:hypothetical protein